MEIQEVLFCIILKISGFATCSRSGTSASCEGAASIGERSPYLLAISRQGIARGIL
jgi:hypothetical protein